jgi:hypothetical protein
MSSKHDADPTPAQMYKQFETGLRKVLSVSKTELLKREKEYQDSRPIPEMRRGPKPKREAKSGPQ